jgi:hypothetical protein
MLDRMHQVSERLQEVGSKCNNCTRPIQISTRPDRTVFNFLVAFCTWILTTTWILITRLCDCQHPPNCIDPKLASMCGPAQCECPPELPIWHRGRCITATQCPSNKCRHISCLVRRGEPRTPHLHILQPVHLHPVSHTLHLHIRYTTAGAPTSVHVYTTLYAPTIGFPPFGARSTAPPSDFPTALWYFMHKTIHFLCTNLYIYIHIHFLFRLFRGQHQSQ